MKRLFLATALLLSACAGLSPRFSQEVAASFARDEMRRLETPSLVLYYPASHAEAALRIAGRLESCVGQLRAMPPRDLESDKLLVYLTTADFNNAYVQPIVQGHEQQMVLPLHMSLEVFDLYNIGTAEIGDVSCHEALHYVQFQQISGFWRGLNFLSGGVLSPQSFFDTWFMEGLATHYEARQGKSVGRPFSPFWRAGFMSGFASESGNMGPGSLSALNRKGIPFGAHYLVGQMFVDYLARRYGEKKLWALIDKQGSSIFSPLGVTLRFSSVFGKNIGSLFDDFTRELRKDLGARARPADQKVLADDIGYNARLASSPDGALALVSAGRDEPIRLTVRERDGSERFSTGLVQFLPPRRWIVASVDAISGLSFSADGKWLYLVSADVDTDTSYIGRLWKVDARNGDVVEIYDGLTGPGGCVEADGKGYVYVDHRGSAANLARYDFASRSSNLLTRLEAGTTVAAPACSPQGDRILFSQHSSNGFDLFARTGDGAVTQLTADGKFNYGARFVDASRAVFLRETSDGRVQAHLFELETGRIAPITEAPFAAFDVAPAGGTLAFLNRDGWGWSLDSAPLQPRTPLALALPPKGGPVLLAQAGDLPLPPPPPLDPPSGEMVRPPPPPPSPVQAAATQPADPALANPAYPAPPTEQPAVTQRPLKVQSDEPYSAWERLFVPTMHVPYLWTAADALQTPYTVAGLSLLGGDRLGMHNWALNLSYDTRDKLPSLSLGYATYLAAPWYLEIVGALVRLDGVYDKQVSLGATRDFWTTPFRLGFELLDVHDALAAPTPTDPNAVRMVENRFVGPNLQFAWSAVETTPYSGPRAGFVADASLSYYPKALSSYFNLGDVSGGLTAYVPLPLLKRHRLALSGSGRLLLGAQGNQTLDIGGIPNGSVFFHSNGLPSSGNVSAATDTQLFSIPRPAFAVPLRGYEDVAVPGSGVGIAQASYQWPLIVDRGWASFLFLLPSFFVRQVDFEAFGVFAAVARGEPLAPDTRWALRRAAGGAIHLRCAMLDRIPLSLYYQFAWRADSSVKQEHLIGLSFD